MKRTDVRSVSRALLLLAFLGAPAWAQEKGWEKEWNETVAAARKEGKLVILGGSASTYRELIARFQSRFGVPVEHIGSGADVRGRLRTDRGAGVYKYDLLFGGIGTVYPLHPEKVFDPVKPLLILPEVLDPSKWKKGKLWFMDPEGIYFPRLLSAVGTDIFVNTAHVKPGELQRAKDLLDPKWKGKISADDPTVTGGGAGVAARMLYLFGEDFLRRLYIDQRPLITRNRTQLADWLAEGNYPISLEPDKGRWQQLQKQGHPLTALINLKDYPPSVGVGGGLVALLNRAPHPNAARVFMNWLASREGMEMFSRARLEPTTRNDVDESFLRPELIPVPGKEYFDTAGWDFQPVKERAPRYMRELLRTK